MSTDSSIPKETEINSDGTTSTDDTYNAESDQSTGDDTPGMEVAATNTTVLIIASIICAIMFAFIMYKVRSKKKQVRREGRRKIYRR